MLFGSKGNVHCSTITGYWWKMAEGLGDSAGDLTFTIT